MLTVQTNDEDENLSSRLAEENPECPLGREALIALAFDSYKEYRRLPEAYRKAHR